jgi:hypothetical protein
MFKIIYGLIMLLAILPISNYANDIVDNQEIVLQIEGQRSGKSYHVDIYAHGNNLVIFYFFSLDQDSFTKKHIDSFKENELKTFYMLLDEIKKMETFHTKSFRLSYDIKHFKLETNCNSVSAYINREIDTKPVQKLIAFIINKSGGKLDFLYFNDYFTLDNNLSK